jgi:Zn-dependent peptidase ImmA (M78 family)
MTKALTRRVSARRHLLQNPYAYIEDLEEVDEQSPDKARAPLIELQISKSRKLLQDPYAYLDDEGRYSAQTTRSQDGLSKLIAVQPKTETQTATAGLGADRDRRYSDQEIEFKVREIHQRMWSERLSIWGDAVPVDPVDMLDPVVALELIGYEHRLEEGLGKDRNASGRFEVAGLIDRSSRTVLVSSQFPLSIRAFTAAHELGHAMLHSVGGVHRDRPLDGASRSRERLELEADKFAAYFLMPARLVRLRFASFFQSDTFVLNEETSSALAANASAGFQKEPMTRRDLSRILAAAKSFKGRQFVSLASQFRVSVEAMAIRIEELGLVGV